MRLSTRLLSLTAIALVTGFISGKVAQYNRIKEIKDFLNSVRDDLSEICEKSHSKDTTYFSVHIFEVFKNLESFLHKISLGLPLPNDYYISEKDLTLTLIWGNLGNDKLIEVQLDYANIEYRLRKNGKMVKGLYHIDLSTCTIPIDVLEYLVD